MKRSYIAAILLAMPLIMGAGIPSFFSGLIGKNVKKYCEMPVQEQKELLQSVNMYTDSHQVVIVCDEKLAKAQPEQTPSRSARIAR